MTILLYEHPRSYFAQKVKVALREKGIPFRAEIPDNYQGAKRAGPYVAANPRAQIPVLIDGETQIFDSTVILEYIEDSWPSPPLLPKAPAARAFARITEEMCDTHYEPVNWAYLEISFFKRATGELADILLIEARRQTRLIQEWLAGRLADAAWFGGERFGWADIAAVLLVERSTSFGLGPDPASKLGSWHAKAREWPSVAATLREAETMAGGGSLSPDRFMTGERLREYRDHRLEWIIKSGGIDIVQKGLRDRTIRFTWPDPTQPSDGGVAGA